MSAYSGAFYCNDSHHCICIEMCVLKCVLLYNFAILFDSSTAVIDFGVASLSNPTCEFEKCFRVISNGNCVSNFS